MIIDYSASSWSKNDTISEEVVRKKEEGVLGCWEGEGGGGGVELSLR